MAASKSVLLLGGHGKVSLLMTPHLVARAHNLTSVIRNPDQRSAILEAGSEGPGKVSVLVESLSDIKSESDAQKVLDKVKPDWVIWSAGAGGKGGVSATYAIDRDACTSFIKASINSSYVSKFLLVSALLARRNRADWWSDESWEVVHKTNTETMPDYFKAKLASDEALTVLGEDRRAKDKDFRYIILRPGNLSDDPLKGSISLGKSQGKGQVTRADVADVGTRLLDSDANGWFDLLNGNEDTEDAIERVIAEGINSMEGEDIEVMRKDL